MRIGVISDTHNYFDPKIPSLFEGVGQILHAGDIGSPRIIHELRKIAPVRAVAGNTDDPGLRYPLVEVATVANRKFLVHHIVNPRQLEETLACRIAKERPSVVIFGHTHKPFSESIDDTLFFNPGYAGQSRFGMPRSLAILHCGEKGIEAEYFALG